MSTNDNLKGKINVCGHRVLLDIDFDSNEIQDGPLAGFKMETDESYDRSKAATITGKVVAIGPTAWKAFDGQMDDWKPWCAVGDKVVFAKYGGKFITIKDKVYLIVNDEDIQAVLLEDEE